MTKDTDGGGPPEESAEETSGSRTVDNEDRDVDATASEARDETDTESEPEPDTTATAEDQSQEPTAQSDDQQRDRQKTKGPDEKFCGSCGQAIKKEAEICPHCGVRTTSGQQSTSKSSGASEESNEKFCGSCGERIKKEAEICPHCGVRTTSGKGTSSADGEKDEGVAAIISFFIPGAGQIYNEQMERGIAVLVVYGLFWLITFVLMFVLIGFVLMFIAPVFHVVAAWDAYTQAQKINAGEIQV